MPGHSHRAGSLKQTNKRNKRSKASKRSAARAAGGKVAGTKGNLAQSLIAQSKADRRNQQHQRRQAKRQERRSAVTSRVVGIISLGEDGSVASKLRDFLQQGADQVATLPSGSVMVKYNAHKKDGMLTLLTPSREDETKGSSSSSVQSALDLARVCDLLLFVLDGNSQPKGPLEMQIGGDSKSVTTPGPWDHLISERGDDILTALKAQGLPTPRTVLAHTEKTDTDDAMTMQSVKSLRRSRVKRQLELKKYVSRFATTEFGTDHDKVVEVDLSSVEEMDVDTDQTQTARSSLVRTLCSMSASPSKWVHESPRPYIIADSYEYSDATQELSMTGYVRGSVPLDVNSLLHLPGLGTFPCKSVQKAAAPFSRAVIESASALYPDPQLQESTDMFAAPDPLEGEQNLIGFEDEDFEPDDDNANMDEKVARPAGWSDYQSAWLDAVDEAEVQDIDHGELAEALNKKPVDEGMADSMELDDANDVTAEERKALIEQRRKEQSEHQEFPDEVQVDEDEKAHERFARYRSLKNFRKSYWDPREGLPETYSTLFHFKSFKTTQRSVLNYMKDVSRASEAVQGNFWGLTPNLFDEMTDEDDDILRGFVPSGSYVTLRLRNVPADSKTMLTSKDLVVAVSLLEHENKVSVVHAGLVSKVDDDISSPLKSKDALTFRCGWRTWQGRPVFSQHNLNCDKHKFERYMPPNGTYFAASVFGPVTYSPCPVLVFRGDGELVASGSILGADADRIVVKRIVLTGYPVRVHKRYATVKYMFYNPDDVKWFKPAGLYTKHGLQGNIIQSVGEHGTMKCLFNAPIKQHDTVCLPLYKRIYPKYVDDQSREAGQKAKLRVL